MGRYFALIAFLVVSYYGYSQDAGPATFLRIDSFVSKKKNLSDVSRELQALKQKALGEKRYFVAARCYYYLVLIADQRTEDSLYFRNSAIIDSALSSGVDKPELLFAMHILQAKRLMAFDSRSLRFNRQRYERRDIPINYAAYNERELDSLATIHLSRPGK